MAERHSALVGHAYAAAGERSRFARAVGSRGKMSSLTMLQTERPAAMNGRPFLFERCFHDGLVTGLKGIPQGLKPRLFSEANVRAEARTLQKPVPS